MYRSTWSNHRVRCIEGPDGMNKFRKFTCGFCSSSFLARDHLRWKSFLSVKCFPENNIVSILGSTNVSIQEKSHGNVPNARKDFSTGLMIHSSMMIIWLKNFEDLISQESMEDACPQVHRQRACL